MKPWFVAVALVVLCGFAAAEDKTPAKVVRVVGTADVKVVPDRAVIELGVEKQDPSASAAKQAEDAVARKILAALRSNGVDEKDVQTTYLSLEPRSSYHKGVRHSWFVASQTLTVTVRDLKKLDSLLEALIKAGGNRIDSIVYETSDLRKYRDQARELAVKAAREKAEALAKALGQDIGKAQAIEEQEERGYGYAGMFRNATFDAYEVPGKSRGATTAAGQQSISASVTVSFELL